MGETSASTSKNGSADTEAPPLHSADQRKGGWITFPFITGGMAGLTLAAAGLIANLIVFLITEFNVKSIDAAQVFNVVNGCMALFPVIGAVIADSFLGCFTVIWISGLINLLGMILITLTATLSSLRPSPCSHAAAPSPCQPPSPFQYGILILALTLSSLGVAGTRFTFGTMGANQLDNPKHQENFFNWFLFTWNAASVISATAIVYVQDSVSWTWGYGLCAAANVFGLIIFMCGKRYYRDVKPQGSPFKNLARVIVAAISKRKLHLLSTKGQDYHSEPLAEVKGSVAVAAPTETFKFLNRAALVTEADMDRNGSIKQSWKLCTVEQVEDFKTLIRLIPLWTTGIFLSTPFGVQLSLTVLQALTMDRHIGPHFQIPAGSVSVFVLLSGALAVPIIDRVLCPTWQMLTGRSLTPLQRLGVGHALNLLGMAISAIVETRRLHVAKAHQPQDSAAVPVVPMSVLWLVPQLVASGTAEAFHFPGQASLYYQEFPASLKSTSTAMAAMLIGIAFYMSSALIDLFRKVTNWLPDNINDGRIDNVYWVLVVIGGFNFGYYLICSCMYRYQNHLVRNKS